MNQKEQLVSVVIPVYNRAHIISRTLKSVSGQSYKNLEVLVVDDCSSDSSELIRELEKFSELDIKYCRHELNLHGGAARNTGIDLASGDYIAFLDSDDEWLPNKVSDCINEMSFSDLDFVYGQLKVIKDNIVAPSRGLNEGERLSDYVLMNGGTIQTSTIFIRAEVAKKVRFDDSLKRFQDYDFIVSLEKYGAKSRFINKPHAIMHDDDKGNRISNSYNPEPAFIWVKKIEDYISSESKSVFFLSRIVKYVKMDKGAIASLKVLFSIDIKHIDRLEKLKWIAICLTPRLIIYSIIRLKKLKNV